MQESVVTYSLIFNHYSMFPKEIQKTSKFEKVKLLMCK